MEVLVLHKKSDVVSRRSHKGMDSVAQSRINMDERSRGQELLLEAQHHYMAAYRYRRERERNKKYNYGDQWSDVVSVDGETMTEEEYIKRQGNVPLVQNLIRRLTRSVLGTFRDQQSEPMCVARDRDEQREAETLSTLLQYNMQLNRMGEMNARAMEEFLIGGMPVHKKVIKWRDNRVDNWTYNVPPNAFIMDSNMRDYRGWDCTLVGQIHDYDWTSLLTEYAKSPADYQRLTEIYGQARDVINGVYSWREFGYSDDDGDGVENDFLIPRDPTRCRVIELWKKESRPRYHCHDVNTGRFFKIEERDYPVVVEAENARRMAMAAAGNIPADEVPLIEAEWFMDSLWWYYYLSPMGDILQEGETPYKHGSHPYVFKPYPFIDGEIHSFVSDTIDTQRYTSRLLMLNDMILRSSAKGLLVVPRGCVDGLTEEEIGEIWARPNGVLVVDADKYGNMPQQISANLTNVGIHEMLSLELKFFEDISGVNPSLQGKPNFSGESGSHAQMMAQNAATSLLDILESFNDFETESAYKDIKNIQQCYDEKTVLNIAGRTAKGADINAGKVLDTEVDISVAPSRKTPAHRMLANEFYINLFNQHAIGLEQLLESVSDIPYADELLQSIKSQRQAAEQGQVPEGVSPELLSKVRGGLQTNPAAMAQLEQAVGSAA